MHHLGRFAFTLAVTFSTALPGAEGRAQRPPQEALWDGAKTGDVTVVERAIADGADVNALDTRTNPNGRRALNWAAWFNQPEIIRLLVSQGAKLDLGNHTGFTPLHHAAENGSLEAAKALLDAGANTRIKNGAGLTPLDVATERERPAIAALLRQGAP